MFNICVLLIEDTQSVAQAIQVMLQDSQPRGWNIKYSFKKVESLEEAKEKLKKGEGYDVILLDLKLKDSEGLETFREVYKEAKAPIIVLSGTADFETIRQLLQEGAAQVFEKHVVATHHELLPRAMVASIENYLLRGELHQARLKGLPEVIFNCTNCLRWRDVDEYRDPRAFLKKHHIHLTDGLCPDCAKLHEVELLAPRLLT